MLPDNNVNDTTVIENPNDRSLPIRIRLMGACLILFAFILAYLFIAIWPSVLSTDKQVMITLWKNKLVIPVSQDIALILLVMVTGGLGSFVHIATSFGDYVGNKAFASSWAWWYLLRPFIGMILALVSYLVIRGGFLSAGTSADTINPFGIAALAGLVGMFSKQATDKLNEVFETLFRTAPGGGDSKRKDNLTNPTPVISDFVPNKVEPGTSNLLVTIIGTGFVKGAVVKVKGTNRETEFVDETKLTAKLLSNDVENEGEIEVSIFNPPPGGGESAVMKLKIAKT